MNRYVIVCLLKGDIVEFHDQLVKKTCDSFSVKRQMLPAHFTIKAPFETDDVSEIEAVTESFAREAYKSEITVDGFKSFGRRVIYMPVALSQEGRKTCESFIDQLKKVDGLEWKRNEKGEKTYHCTIVSKLDENKFHDIWQFVSETDPHFKLSFNNITIMKWERYRWVVHREYELK